jgi:hypothetical protein
MPWGVTVWELSTKPPTGDPSVLLYIHTNKGRANASTPDNEFR